MKHQDKIGKKFNRLTVLSLEYRDEHYFAFCRCDCGTEKEVRFERVLINRIKSCGCLKRELNKAQFLTHNLSNTSEHRSWMSMRQRCLNPNEPRYKSYGGRGIKICDRWIESFENFLEDLGFKPTLKHTLERKDVNGDYTPENCCWATNKEQSRNRQDTIYFEISGEKKSLIEWCEIYNVSYDRVRSRVKRGIDIKLALTLPKNYNASQTV